MSGAVLLNLAQGAGGASEPAVGHDQKMANSRAMFTVLTSSTCRSMRRMIRPETQGRARGNFEPESSHFRPVGWLRPLGRRLTLCPGGRGQIARMGTFGVIVPI